MATWIFTCTLLLSLVITALREVSWRPDWQLLDATLSKSSTLLVVKEDHILAGALGGQKRATERCPEASYVQV